MSTPSTDEIALHAAIATASDKRFARLIYAEELQLRDPLAACVQRIVAEPDNDSHRLAYVSELESGQHHLECSGCNNDPVPGNRRWCRQCFGKGRILPDAIYDRCEFIRVQCELERKRAKQTEILNDETDCVCPSPEDSKCDPACPLHAPTSKHACGDGIGYLCADQDKLLKKHCLSWLPECLFCSGTGRYRYESFPSGEPYLSDTASCGHCKGTGRIGEMKRGFLRKIWVPKLSDVLAMTSSAEQALLDYGPWKPTLYARELFRGDRAAVQMIRVGDKIPLEFALSVGDDRFFWLPTNTNCHIGREQVPNILAEEMVAAGATRSRLGSACYRTQVGAVDGLGFAIASVLRDMILREGA